MQPTDFRVWSVFVSFGGAEAARRNERAAGLRNQAVVEAGHRDRPMMHRMRQIAWALSAIAAAALAGGASLNGF